MSSICPNCENTNLTVFFKVQGAPTNSCILLKTEEEAKQYPKGDIELGYCKSCGFVSNTVFDSKLTEYDERYEETQGFSETFNSFHKALAERLIDKHNLNNKTILEVGCGKGEFLVLLCELGNNTGLGFDPGFPEERIPPELGHRLTFIKDFYSEKYAKHKADFVCCKMTLEHIPQTKAFLSMIRRSIGDKSNTLVFFQIPNAERILSECAFEDIFYEHCSYFSAESLSKLFADCQFDVLDITYEYDDQYLAIEAKPTAAQQGDILSETALAKIKSIDVETLIAEFSENLNAELERWHELIARYTREGKSIAIWGSGSKATAFLQTLKLSDEIGMVIDINPHKTGYRVAGSGHLISAPKDLVDFKPDAVIVMNPIYRSEIAKDLNSMGLAPDLYTL